MKITKILLVIVFSMICTHLAADQRKRVLMVISGYGVDAGKTQPGYEFEEFAKAYLIFKHNDILVDVASPQGGKVEADGYKASIPFNKKVLDDKHIMTKLSSTLPIASVNSSQYDAIFVVGGKGAMFDLPNNVNLQKVIADIYQNSGSVAAVCHGPAALTNVKLNNGDYLVAGKTVNSFTNVEENIFGQKWLPKFSFLLEDKLIERGATFESSEMMMSHVAVDGRLITGQNPASTPGVVEALIHSMGLEPKARTPFHDETTLNLIAQLLKREITAVISAQQAYQQSPDKYNARLVGMYGYYRAAYAKSEHETEVALSLMTLVSADVNNPKLDMAMAKGYQKLGQVKKAKSILENIIVQHPEYENAKEMLEKL